jgi:hypothetical protein
MVGRDYIFFGKEFIEVSLHNILVIHFDSREIKMIGIID